MICNTLLGQFCFEHVENWEELLSNEPYNLKISRVGKYIMFKYNQLSSDFNEPIVREARGIIFKEHKWDYPVCHGFNKFGNFGESYVPEIDWSTAKVTEKIDGSLIKLWFDDDCWHISTNGQIRASDANFSDCHYDNFSHCFVNALKLIGSDYNKLTASLSKTCTYMFELVSPYNRVVIPYEKENVYYLGARHNESGNEYPFYNEYTSTLIDLTGISLPKVYDLNKLDDVIASAAELPWDEEGYVVCDVDSNRCKIKSTKYVHAHFARNNNVVTFKHLLEVVLNNEQSEFLIYAEDYKDQLKEVEFNYNSFKGFLKSSKQMILDTIKYFNITDKKSFATSVKILPKVIQPYVFKLWDNRDYSVEEYTATWDIHKWERNLEAYIELLRG